MKRSVLNTLTVVASLWTFVSSADESKPHIIFVMIDDLGAEQVGVYGGESYQTPNMDALAEQGMLFNNVFAQPMCMVSRATLMSGRYGYRSGLPKNIDSVASTGDGWGKNEITVANLLQDAGYTTAISGKWHLGKFDVQPNHLTDKGFAYQNAWAWIVGNERTRRYWETTYYREKKFVTDGPGIYGPDQFCKYVTDFMTDHKDDEQPFFIYYPMVLVHSPFPQTPDHLHEPQSGWTPEDNLRTAENKKWNENNYASMVEYTDKLIGRIVRKMDELGIMENTLLIVTADNGSYKRSSAEYLGQTIKGGKGSVTDGGTRVPFIACWKGMIQPGSVNENLVDFTDVLPTLVQLGGGEFPKNLDLDGMSFLDQMLGQENAPSRDWVFMGNLPKGMIRADQFSLDAADQLYDLRKNRYKPALVKKGTYTEIHQTYYNRLSVAMESLDHPYTKGPGGQKVGRKKLKKKSKKGSSAISQ
ncbi:MAG: sulfatase-like hydrolase/transferase [Pontiella sp.]